MRSKFPPLICCGQASRQCEEGNSSGLANVCKRRQEGALLMLLQTEIYYGQFIIALPSPHNFLLGLAHLFLLNRIHTKPDTSRMRVSE